MKYMSSFSDKIFENNLKIAQVITESLLKYEIKNTKKNDLLCNNPGNFVYNTNKKSILMFPYDALIIALLLNFLLNTFKY